MKKIRWLVLLLVTGNLFAQQLSPLTVQKIMRNPKWIGSSPSKCFLECKWEKDLFQLESKTSAFGKTNLFMWARRR